MNTKTEDRGMIAYQRFLNGDEGGLAVIIEEYGDRLLRYINSYVHDEMTAEDLLSETFLKLIVRRPRLRGEALFKTYLYAIGRNEALGWLRRQRHEVSLAEWLPDKHAEEAYGTVLRREQKRVLYRALEQIPPLYREVLYLAYFEGLSCREVASVLRKNSRQITNVLYRGKQALRAVMEREGADYEDL
ncbi:MAG: RNA polymerase sigma factor [Clostridia bacterium]|nr:RNA polymerase sigma factor [Clostridia bacterium]